MKTSRIFLIALVCLAMFSAAAQVPETPPEITPEATTEVDAESMAEVTDEPVGGFAAVPYVWQAVGLTVLAPTGWQVATSVDGARNRHELVFRSGDEHMIYVVLDETFTDVALYNALDAEMRERRIFLTNYLGNTYFGRVGWSIDGVITPFSATAQIARLPDDGTIMLIVVELLDSGRTFSLYDGVRFGVVPQGTSVDTILSDVPVQTQLDAENSQRIWNYQGTAGETITLSAVDLARIVPGDLGLDMAIRVLAPDGREVAYNDDQPGVDLFGVYDAHISNLVLPADGAYQIAVEWVQGSGTATLGLNSTQSHPLDADGTTEIGGEWRVRLQDAIPYQGYAITARAGQTFTITMTADSGDLDPALELFNPDGSTLVYNDDALNLELGTTAQIVNLTIPADGVYVLEASRFAGSGRYRVVIVETNR